jgi:predicted transcriptional regulator
VLNGEGKRQQEIALMLGVSQATVSYWLAENNAPEEEATIISADNSSLPEESQIEEEAAPEAEPAGDGGSEGCHHEAGGADRPNIK